MRFAWMCVLVLAGCPADDSSDYPVRPGAGGGTIIDDPDRPDAAPAPDGAPAVSGRVCLLTDPRDWTVCATTTAAGLSVTIGSETVTTGTNGVFTFSMPPVGTQIEVDVGGLVNISKFTTGADSIAAVAINAVNWDSWQDGTGFAVTDGNGAIVLELRDDGNRRAGITADSVPPPGPGAQASVFYGDDTGFFTWNDISTSAMFSKALFADLPAGNVTVTATVDARMGSDTFPVEADSITWGTVDIPPDPP